MKNFFLVSLMLITGIVTFPGCTEGNLSEGENFNSEVVIRRIPLYQAGWDEWSRASKDCGSWGLCNFVDCWLWEDNYPCVEPFSGGSGTLSFTNSGNGTLEIILNPNKKDEYNVISNQETLIKI